MAQTCLIAEVGMNHDGSFGNACRLIDVAATCGADVVKFQTHVAEAETLPDAPCPPYFTEEPRDHYFRRTAFDLDQWRALKQHAEARGLRFLSSVFSVEAVALLERINVEAYKIPSGEVTNLPLIDEVAKTKRPVFLSSGMSQWAELDAAVETIRRHHHRLTVLQCTSEYPCPPERVGLNVLGQMRQRYHVPVGLSDHTMSNYAAFAAAALGASVIEKHLTLSRLVYGSDAKHSLEPAEFADLVRGVRVIEAMQTAPVNKDDIERFRQMRVVFQKSVVSVTDIPAGATITAEMLAIKKPGMGLPAHRYGELVGLRAARTIPAHHVLTEEDIDWRAR